MQIVSLDCVSDTFINCNWSRRETVDSVWLWTVGLFVLRRSTRRLFFFLSLTSKTFKSLSTIKMSLETHVSPMIFIVCNSESALKKNRFVSIKFKMIKCNRFQRMNECNHDVCLWLRLYGSIDRWFLSLIFRHNREIWRKKFINFISSFVHNFVIRFSTWYW